MKNDSAKHVSAHALAGVTRDHQAADCVELPARRLRGRYSRMRCAMGERSPRPARARPGARGVAKTDADPAGMHSSSGAAERHLFSRRALGRAYMDCVCRCLQRFTTAPGAVPAAYGPGPSPRHRGDAGGMSARCCAHGSCGPCLRAIVRARGRARRRGPRPLPPFPQCLLDEGLRAGQATQAARGHHRVRVGAVGAGGPPSNGPT